MSFIVKLVVLYFIFIDLFIYFQFNLTNMRIQKTNFSCYIVADKENGGNMDFDKEIYDKFSNSRLSIKKKNVRFLELLFKYNGIEIIHDHVIEIAYNFREPLSCVEQMFKNYLLAFEYIIESNQNDVDVDYLKKVYYLCKGEELSTEKACDIQSYYYKINNKSYIENAIIFHYYLYDVFKDDDTIFKNIIPLFFLTRELLKVGLSTFKMVDFQYVKYLNSKTIYDETKNIIPTFILLEKIYSEEKVQPIEYLENIKPLKINDIKKALFNISNLLDDYGIKTIIIFGSFSKNMQRENSDIDLYINVIDDVSYKEKEKRISIVKEILHSKLNRYVDIQELSYPIISNLIKEIKHGKLIYNKGDNNE